MGYVNTVMLKKLYIHTHTHIYIYIYILYTILSHELIFVYINIFSVVGIENHEFQGLSPVFKRMQNGQSR